MENKTVVGIIVVVAVAVLMGAILVQIIADNTGTVTQVTGYSETISIAAAKANAGDYNTTNFRVTKYPTGWKAEDCPLTNVVIKNSTGTALTETTSWVLNKNNGTFYLVNSSQVTAGFLSSNNSVVVYSYCGDDYINSSWGRTIAKLVPGFYALGILLAAAFVIFWILKKEGVSLEV